MICNKFAHRWILNLMNERLLIEDLEIKMFTGRKYKPNKKKKQQETVVKEQGIEDLLVFDKDENRGLNVDADWVLIDKEEIF